MDAEYWLQRWREQRTDWHRDEVMPLLKTHWPILEAPQGARVLVPFCGKSLDMLWLAAQGMCVLGVELSPLAVEVFFADNRLAPERWRAADGMHYSAGDIEIIQGDLFATRSETLASCDAVYDRAAIIAQPAPLRARYAKEIYGRLPGGCRGLIITLEYPQAEMDGPPFAVDEAELRRLFSERWEIQRLERCDILHSRPAFREAGLTALHTAVYRLDKHRQV